MKPKPNSNRYRAELTDSEITVLLTFYDEALSETEKCKSSIIQEQRVRNAERRAEIARYRDGRCWNKGKGRTPKLNVDDVTWLQEGKPTPEG